MCEPRSISCARQNSESKRDRPAPSTSSTHMHGEYLDSLNHDSNEKMGHSHWSFVKHRFGDGQTLYNMMYKKY